MAEERRCRVLVSNDDGPESSLHDPFLQYLTSYPEFDVYVCLPESQRSWASKSISRFEEVRVVETGDRVWHCSGQPATCVNVALHHLVQDVDLVISGPNYGHNAGRASILSSGTVGGAVEAVLSGVRAISVSMLHTAHVEEEEEHRVCQVAARTVWKLWQSWPSNAEVDLFNVNVPSTCSEDPKVFMAPVHVDTYGSLYTPSSQTEKQVDGRSITTYTHAGRGMFHAKGSTAPQGTDAWCIYNGHVSVTPFHAGLHAVKLSPTEQPFPRAPGSEDNLVS